MTEIYEQYERNTIIEILILHFNRKEDGYYVVCEIVAFIRNLCHQIFIVL